jgi:hypothetical protein
MMLIIYSKDGGKMDKAIPTMGELTWDSSEGEMRDVSGGQSDSYDTLYTTAKNTGWRVPYAPNDPTEQQWMKDWGTRQSESNEYAREGTPFSVGVQTDQVKTEQLGNGMNRTYYRDNTTRDWDPNASNDSFMGNLLGGIAKYGTIAGLSYMSGGVAGGLGAIGAGAVGGAVGGTVSGTEGGPSGMAKGAAIGGVAGGIAGGVSSAFNSAPVGEGAGLTELAPQAGAGGYGSYSASLPYGDVLSGKSSVTEYLTKLSTKMLASYGLNAAMGNSNTYGTTSPGTFPVNQSTPAFRNAQKPTYSYGPQQGAMSGIPSQYNKLF